ncbi:hypothetical protein TorRG33x02_354540, partial [Trema orientale]
MSDEREREYLHRNEGSERTLKVVWEEKRRERDIRLRKPT